MKVCKVFVGENKINEKKINEKENIIYFIFYY